MAHPVSVINSYGASKFSILSVMVGLILYSLFVLCSVCNELKMRDNMYSTNQLQLKCVLHVRLCVNA